MGKKGEKRFVVTLMRNGEETREMSEVFDNILKLEKAYIFLSQTLKKKKKKKLNLEKIKKGPEVTKKIEPKSVNSQIVNPPRAVPAPLSSSVTSSSSSSNKLALLSQIDPNLEKDISIIFGDSPPITPKKNFLDSDRSPKPLAEKNTKKLGGKPQPPASKGAQKEIPETPKISSIIDVITPSPKNKWNVDRQKWESRRQSLVDGGCDLDDVRTGRKDLQRWDGVSTKPAGKRKETFYVVWNGNTTGVFSTWAKAQASISGYPKAGFKKVLGTEREAIQLLEEMLKGD